MTFLTISNILPKETGFMNKDNDWHKKSKYARLSSAFGK